MKNKQKVVLLIVLLSLGALLYKALGDAIDQEISNQDRMLCDSAKVSGNQQYIARCESLGLYK